MYLLSGALTALCGLAMMVAPLSPTTYAVGVSVYLFIAGFCYAAFSAAVLETIGKGGAAASTQYALFVVVRQLRHQLRRAPRHALPTRATARAACSASTRRSISSAWSR